MDMRQVMVSATHSNMSANIQRENIMIMTGNATPTDKLNLIRSQYSTALSIGDNSLAQQLESQAYSLSQTIQSTAQSAGAASATLAKANAGNQESVATTLDNGLKLLNQQIRDGGMNSMTATIDAFIHANSTTLQTLGVNLKSDPNYFDVVSGVAGAMYNAHMLAAQAVQGTDPYAAQEYMGYAQNIVNGATKLSTLGGSLSIQQVMQAAASPAEYAYDATKGSLVQTKQTGFDGYDANGQPMPTYSGTLKQTVFLTPTQTAQMTKLGLNFTMNTSGKNAGTTGNGVQVQTTGNTPDWLKQVLGGNGIANMYSVNGQLQFEADSSTGAGKAYYTLGVDSRGLMGLFQNSGPGQTIALGGEYGFNQSGVQEMINNATSHEIQIQQQAQQAQIKLQQQAPLSLPTINPPVSAPPATISIKPPPTLQPVNPVTVNPQQTAPGNRMQGGGGINIQGGSGGSGGISIGSGGYLGGGNISF
jgi:hypothetical protein